MSQTINLDIPHTAAERIKREAESIHGLIKRMESRASDGRYYHLEDKDRAEACALLRRYLVGYYRDSREDTTVSPLSNGERNGG